MVKESLPALVVSALRVTRQLAYIGLEPLDYLARLINGKSDFPPLYLRRQVGPLRTFEMSGAEFMAYLRLLCKLRPTESLLDIGCGCGLMALFLTDYLDATGSYTGLDIHRPSIRWCRKYFAKYPNFNFAFMDVRSLAYNARGRFAAEDYSFDLEDRHFDLVLLKSVFTHLRPAEVDNYLRQISRILSDDARCLMTFFLLNEVQAELARSGLNQLDFKQGEGVWRYVYRNSPESAVAFDETHVLGMLRNHGLELSEPAFYGTWTGRVDGLSFQDMLLVRKRHVRPS
ncbi:MAG TPA: class I SAM-dependent methyltransferase [Pyrinomonadaceae bacterium]|nr:class I SAM-dependent methyltransferase [Pyrinomonadaceae bacterium]